MADLTVIFSFDDDIVMECDGVLSEINYESFQECIGGAMEEVLKKNEKAHEVARSLRYLPLISSWSDRNE